MSNNEHQIFRCGKHDIDFDHSCPKCDQEKPIKSVMGARGERYDVGVLNEREKTHGDYGENSGVAQGIKTLMHYSPGWERMTKAQRESIDLIATKLGRLSAGNPAEVDHWKDIAGYAMLGGIWTGAKPETSAKAT